MNPTPARDLRVLIADDHPVFLDGLGQLLDSTPGLRVVGTAPDGERLLELARATEHDVVVVDLDMPVLDGAGATRALVDTHGTRVLVLTMHADDASVSRALRAGAAGYVLKGAGHGAIARAVFAVAEGDVVLGGSVGASVVAAATSARPNAAFPELSAREVEVLAMVAAGRTNAQVAAELYLSVKTVQNHVSSLLSKTGSSHRAELVARARDAGIVADR